MGSKLSHRFGGWDMRGICFDMDLHPNDKRDMVEDLTATKNLVTSRLDAAIETVDKWFAAWYKICNEFQCLNTKLNIFKHWRAIRLK